MLVAVVIVTPGVFEAAYPSYELASGREFECESIIFQGISTSGILEMQKAATPILL
jgi:hypothetical protein